MKVALINDMLVQEGGQERVLRALQEVFVGAPTFVLMYDRQKKEKFYKEQDVRASWLQKMPGAAKHYEWYLPLMAPAIESFDLRNFDLIFSSSSSFAKGVLCQPGVRHICYCHTPTRYLWSDAQGYVEDLQYPSVIKSMLPLYLSFLRNWDWGAAQRVDYFLSNSKTVKERIGRYYNKSAQVIYPPVETDKFCVSNKAKEYFLIGGRLVPYKRYDLAVTAFARLDMPLKVFGVGPELERLKKMAGPKTEFLGEVSEDEKIKLFAEAVAFINPQEEDFGITAVESMAAGRPVIAFKAGGATETVVDGVTGRFFDEQNWEDLANTVIHFDHQQYNSEVIKEYAQKFSKERFKKEVKEFVDGIMLV